VPSFVPRRIVSLVSSQPGRPALKFSLCAFQLFACRLVQSPVIRVLLRRQTVPDSVDVLLIISCCGCYYHCRCRCRRSCPACLFCSANSGRIIRCPPAHRLPLQQLPVLLITISKEIPPLAEPSKLLSCRPHPLPPFGCRAVPYRACPKVPRSHPPASGQLVCSSQALSPSTSRGNLCNLGFRPPKAQPREESGVFSLVGLILHPSLLSKG
jgi:hypothetical protein